MYGTMKSNRAEYDVQPAFNESVLPTCPPSYSEAVASSFRDTPSTYRLPYPKQPDTLSVISGQPQIPVISGEPQAPGFSQQPQAPVLCSNVILSSSQSPFLTLPVPVGPKSVRVRCPYCQANILTNTTTAVKRSAHYCCCLLFFCGCFLCSCIPYCLASFKNVNHTCPQCKSFIGTYRP